MKLIFMKMKQITIFAFAALFTAACSNNENIYDASGMFEATEIVVSAKAQGEILTLNAEEGQEVKTGEVLGTIDARQLSLRKEQLAYTQEQVDNTHAQVVHLQQQMHHNQNATDKRQLDVKTQLATLTQQLDNLQRERARFQALLDKGAATQKQVDDIDYQIRTLEQQIAATREQLASNNASIAEQSRAAASQNQATGSQAAAVRSQSKAIGSQISQVDELISDASITAPRAGTVLQRYAEAGEYAAPGKPLFKIADLSEMFLRAYITADQYDGLKLGQKVKVYVDGQTDEGEPRAYDGQISWIAQKAEFTPKTIQTKDERANLVYAIKIKVKNDGRIKIGMYGDVSFSL